MMPERPTNRVAVLIRGYKFDAKLLDLFAHLCSAHRTYDLFLLMDETKGRPPDSPAGVIWFSLAACPAVGLDHTRADLFWLCGDIPLFFASAALPDHSHFIQLDYDLHFTHDGPTFLNQVIALIAGDGEGGIDAIGLQHAVLQPPCTWPYFDLAASRFDVVRFYYGPFLALSRPAVAYLQTQRQAENMMQPPDVLISEAFVPSHLAQAGFRCVDLLELIPGSYEAWDDTTSMRMQPVGLPLGGRIKVKPAIAMVHPVYSPEDHLARALRHAETPQALSNLRARLQGDLYSFVELELRRQYIHAAGSKLAALAARASAAGTQAVSGKPAGGQRARRQRRPAAVVANGSG